MTSMFSTQRRTMAPSLRPMARSVNHCLNCHNKLQLILQVMWQLDGEAI
jgi:hypothetical protein